MSFIVPEEIKKATTKCKHNFSCLEAGECEKKPLCSVELDVADVLFLNAKEHVNCPYRVFYGGRQLCVCPTHLAIAKKTLQKDRGK